MATGRDLEQINFDGPGSFNPPPAQGPGAPINFDLPSGGIPGFGSGQRAGALNDLFNSLSGNQAALEEFAQMFQGFSAKFPNGMPSGPSGGGGGRRGGGGGGGLSDRGLDFINPKVEGALTDAILGLLRNGGIVGTGFEDAANLLREEETSSTLQNINRNAEMFNSRGLLQSGPRLEGQTDIQEMGQKNLFQALVELELQRLGLMQQGQLGGLSGALGLGRLGLDEFLAGLEAASRTAPGPSGSGGGSGSGSNSSGEVGAGVRDILDDFRDRTRDLPRAGDFNAHFGGDGAPLGDLGWIGDSFFNDLMGSFGNLPRMNNQPGFAF